MPVPINERADPAAAAEARAADARSVSTWVRRVVEPDGTITDEPTRYVRAGDATVGAIMTHATYCVRPGVGIDALVALMLERGLSGLPVVDATGRPIGVVSKTDVVRHHGAPDRAATAHDLMMPLVFSLSHEVPIARAAALMAGEGVHRLPIVDGTGRVCGILSSLDIVRWVAEEAGYRV